MKKWIGLLLILAIAVGLAACGQDVYSEPTTTSNASDAAEPTEATKPDANETAPSDDKNDDAEATEPSEESSLPIETAPGEENTVPTTETKPSEKPQETEPLATDPEEDYIPNLTENSPIVLYDLNNIVITATDFIMLCDEGLEIGLKVKNNSNISVEMDLHHIVLDGYTMPVTCSLFAGAGETRNGRILIPSYYIEKHIFENICQVMLPYANLYNTTSGEKEPFDVVFAVFGIEPGYNEKQAVTEGDMLTSEKLIVDSIEATRDGDYFVFTVLVNNKTDRDIYLWAKDIVLNGKYEAEMTSSVLVYWETVAYVRLVMEVPPDMDYSNGVYSVSFALEVIDGMGTLMWTTDTLTAERN